MLSSQYVQKEKQKNFFLLPNALFDIELHIYALAIYAYLIRIEDRNTYQCIASYTTIANGAVKIYAQKCLQTPAE